MWNVSQNVSPICQESAAAVHTNSSKISFNLREDLLEFVQLLGSKISPYHLLTQHGSEQTQVYMTVCDKPATSKTFYPKAKEPVPRG